MWLWGIRVGKRGSHVLIDVVHMCGVRDIAGAFSSVWGIGSFGQRWTARHLGIGIECDGALGSGDDDELLGRDRSFDLLLLLLGTEVCEMYES